MIRAIMKRKPSSSTGHDVREAWDVVDEEAALIVNFGMEIRSYNKYEVRGVNSMVYGMEALLDAGCERKLADYYWRVVDVAKDFGLELDQKKAFGWEQVAEAGSVKMDVSDPFRTVYYSLADNIDRTSAANSRTLTNIILNEVLLNMKGPPSEEDKGLAYLTAPDDLRIFGEVAFNLPCRVPLEWGDRQNCNPDDFHDRDYSYDEEDDQPLVVSGRVDFVIGRVLGARDTKPKKNSIRNRMLLFESYLVIVQAEVEGRAEEKVPVVVAFLASVHQSRKAKNRGSSVYGIATDGRTFIFASISHDGQVLQSAPLSMMDRGQASVILKSVKYLVEKSREENIMVAPNDGQTERMRLLDDSAFDVDVVEYKEKERYAMDEDEKQEQEQDEGEEVG